MPFNQFKRDPAYVDPKSPPVSPVTVLDAPDRRVPLPEISELRKCDTGDCPAQATRIVFFNVLELVFCTHHFTGNAFTLMREGATW